MHTTYDFRIHEFETYKGKRTTTHYVRWSVAGKRWREGFRVKALAESFRAELVSAAGRGEAFDIETGRPVSMRREQQDMSWYQSPANSWTSSGHERQQPRVGHTLRP